MVDVLDEGGARVEMLVGVAVSDGVNFIEECGDGVGCGKASTVGGLRCGARVADLRGAATHALLVVDDVVDDAADESVELGGDWVVKGRGHGDLI